MKLLYATWCCLLLANISFISAQQSFNEYCIKPVAFGIAFGVGAYAGYTLMKSFKDHKNELNAVKGTLTTIENKLQDVLEKKETSKSLSEYHPVPQDFRKIILNKLNYGKLETNTLFISGLITCLIYVTSSSNIQSRISPAIECSDNNLELKLINNKSTEQTAILCLPTLPTNIYVENGATVLLNFKEKKNFSNIFISLTNKAKLFCRSHNRIDLENVIAIVKDSILEQWVGVSFKDLEGLTNDQAIAKEIPDLKYVKS